MVLRLLSTGLVIATVVLPLYFASLCVRMPVPMPGIGDCFNPVLTAALFIALFWVAVRPYYLADYAAVIAAVVLVVSVSGWLTTARAASPEELPLLRLKSADLASGVIVARPRDYVTLSVDTGDPAQKREFTNLRVDGVYGADGRNVAYTGETIDHVVLGVSKASYDDIVATMKEKKASISLMPQPGQYPTATPSGSPTPVPMLIPTSAPPPRTAVFTLPATKIQSDLDDLKRGAPVLAVLVVERKDADGTVVNHESGRYEATLLDVLEARGGALEQPYLRATQVRLGLSRASDENVEKFARQLAGASAIYLLGNEE